MWGVACACLPQAEGVADAAQQLPFPLFVKPNTAGDSLGMDHDSLVYDTAALLRKASALIEAYGAVLIETYIAGREFTVLVYADLDPRCPPYALLPLEFRFPDREHFKTYDLKVRQFHPECNVPLKDVHGGFL